MDHTEDKRHVATNKDQDQNPIHEITASASNWQDEQVRPIYFQPTKGEISFSAPVVGRMRFKDWLAGEIYDDFNCATPPSETIRGLIRGRIFPSPFYELLGELDWLPVMSAAEVLEMVGVASPTALHLKLASEALQEHLGEPKAIWGQPRWLVPPRINNDALPRALRKRFPVPESKRFAPIYGVVDVIGHPPKPLKQVTQLSLFTIRRDPDSSAALPGRDANEIEES